MKILGRKKKAVAQVLLAGGNWKKGEVFANPVSGFTKIRAVLLPHLFVFLLLATTDCI